MEFQVIESGTEIYTALASGVFIIVLAILAVIYKIKHRKKAIKMDELEGFEFEYYCADLLEANGFYDVEVTPSHGDFGIDILAKKDGITFAIQCKRYSDDVGIKAVQEAYSGRDFYDCMIGCVMTNQYFTNPAKEAAAKLKILLWDRDYVEGLEENYGG